MENSHHLVSHNISQQHNMSRIDIHAVTLHRVLDLVDDGLPRGFNPKNLCDVDDVVGRGLFANDSCERKSSAVISTAGKRHQTFCNHTCLQSITLDEKLFIPFVAAMIVLVLYVNHRPLYTWRPLDADVM